MPREGTFYLQEVHVFFYVDGEETLVNYVFILLHLYTPPRKSGSFIFTTFL